MSLVIALKGLRSYKVIGDVVPVEVTPVVVAGCPATESFGCFGIGYLTKGSSSWFPGLTPPRDIIQAWQSMKLLEKMPKIDRGILVACLHASSQNLLLIRRYHLETLGRLFPSANDFLSAREEVMSSRPSNEEMETMLRVVQLNGVRLSASELKLVQYCYESVQPIQEILAALRAAEQKAAQADLAQSLADEAEFLSWRKIKKFSWPWSIFS